MKKNNFYKLNSTSGSALLFAIITAFVLSFTGASLVILTTNQYRIIDNEINRKIAYYKIRAGVEYANYCLYNRLVSPSPHIDLRWSSSTPSSPDGFPGLPPFDYTNLIISIEEDTSPTPISRYRIRVSTQY